MCLCVRYMSCYQSTTEYTPAESLGGALTSHDLETIYVAYRPQSAASNGMVT